MLIYMAHPLRPVEGETIDGNLADAMAWLVRLIEAKPEWTVIAPWIAEIQAFGLETDRDPAMRAAALRRCTAAAARCDGIVLCGPLISEGMKREAWPVWDATKPVYRAMLMEMPDASLGVRISNMRGWAHEFVNGVPRFLI